MRASVFVRQLCDLSNYVVRDVDDGVTEHQLAVAVVPRHVALPGPLNAIVPWSTIAHEMTMRHLER